MTTSIWAQVFPLNRAFALQSISLHSDYFIDYVMSDPQPQVWPGSGKAWSLSLCSQNPYSYPVSAWQRLAQIRPFIILYLKNEQIQYYCFLLEGLSFSFCPDRSCPIYQGPAQMQPPSWSLLWFHALHPTDMTSPVTMGWRIWKQQNWGEEEHWGKH